MTICQGSRPPTRVPLVEVVEGARGPHLLSLFPDAHFGRRSARIRKPLLVLELQDLVWVLGHLLLHQEDPLVQSVLGGPHDERRHDGVDNAAE